MLYYETEGFLTGGELTSSLSVKSLVSVAEAETDYAIYGVKDDVSKPFGLSVN